MISVVIPAWNAAGTIEETLHSVLGQTAPPAEVIVVDDGSTDGTEKLPILGRHPIRLIRQANQGAAAALNTGIGAASGDLIAFLDADDIWTADKLAVQTAALTAAPDLAGVFGHVEAFACPSASPEDRARWDLAAGSGPGWLAGAVLMRRHRLAGERFDPRLRTGYFIDLLDRLRLAGHEFSMLDTLVMYRRIHAGSLTQRKSEMAAGFLEVARRAVGRRRARAGATEAPGDGEPDD
jgi:glycosyltransferase involved in cell wall biosynthesis